MPLFAMWLLIQYQNIPCSSIDLHLFDDPLYIFIAKYKQSMQIWAVIHSVTIHYHPSTFICIPLLVRQCAGATWLTALQTTLDALNKYSRIWLPEEGSCWFDVVLLSVWLLAITHILILNSFKISIMLSPYFIILRPDFRFLTCVVDKNLLFSLSFVFIEQARQSGE